MADQITPKIKNYTPSGGIMVDAEDELVDIRTLLSGGTVKASLVSEASVSPVIGTATRPKIANMTPFSGIFVDKDDNLIDWLTLLTNGDLQIQVSSIAPGILDQTFITQTDETDTLTNSIPLADLSTGFLSVETETGSLVSRIQTGTENQITITNGSGLSGDTVFSLPSTLIIPGILRLGGNDLQLNGFKITSSAGNPIQLVPDVDADGVELGSSVVTIEEALIHAGEASNKIVFGTNSQSFFVNSAAKLTLTDISATFNTPVRLENDLNITSGAAIINATTGNRVVIQNTDIESAIDLISNDVAIEQALSKRGTPGNNVTFGIGTQAFNISSTSIFDISASGLRLGTTGARINNIDNTGTSFLSTDGVTALGMQLAISAAIDAGASFRGGWDASGDVFPTTGGTGALGVIEQGNWWYITVAGTLNGQDVSDGDWITALVDIPGQTGSNWLISYQGVTSVFGRIGPVVGEAGDYSYNLITGLPTTATTGKLMRGNGTAWAETTATFADTYALNTMLFAGSANAVSGLTTTASSVLSSSAAGLPNWLALTDGKIVIGSSSGAPLAANISSGTAINVTNGANSITITNTAPDQTVVLNNGAGITTSGTYPNFTITNTDLGSSVTLSNAGTTTLVNDGTGPSLAIKGLVSGTGITFTPSATDLTITNSAPDQTVVLNNGAGISATGTYPNFTITNTDLGSSVTLSNAGIAGGTTSLVNDGVGAALAIKGLVSGTNIAVTSNTTDTTISFTGVLPVVNGGTSFSTYAKGDITHASATNTLAKLGIGSTGDVLTVVGGDAAWAAPASGALAFFAVSSSTQALAINSCYYTTYSGLNVMTLPTTSPVGSFIRIIAGPSGNTFKAAQNAGQYIYYGAINGVLQVTTTGTGGYLQSVDPCTTADLVCIVADTVWAVVSNVNDLDWV